MWGLLAPCQAAFCLRAAVAAIRFRTWLGDCFLPRTRAAALRPLRRTAAINFPRVPRLRQRSFMLRENFARTSGRFIARRMPAVTLRR